MKISFFTTVTIITALVLSGCAAPPPKSTTDAAKTSHPWRALLEHEDALRAAQETPPGS